MSNESRTNGANTTVDFTASDSSTPLIFEDRIFAGSITLVRCRTQPSPAGGRIVSPQTTIVVPAGPAFDLEWQVPESDRVRSSTIGRGRVMLYTAGVPVWKRWQGSPSIFVMALAPEFIETIRQGASERGSADGLRTIVGLEDPVADDLVRLAEQELREGGTRGRLFLEGLATSLTAHMLRTVGADQHIERRVGGLAPAQLRRVIEYVEAHLAENETLGLMELATVAGLSPHHFGEAFKAATGLSPHQFVIERRIVRALDLLRDLDRTVAQVALAVGFSSQSHLTTHFRRITGVTPARFRRSLG